MAIYYFLCICMFCDQGGNGIFVTQVRQPNPSAAERLKQNRVLKKPGDRTIDATSESFKTISLNK